MAAVPFSGILKLKGVRSGQSLQYPVTMSDVVGAFYIFPDGSDSLTLPSNDDWALVDVIISVGGTDTANGNIFMNGKTTGEVIQNLANLNNNDARQFFGAAIGLKSAGRLKIEQVA